MQLYKLSANYQQVSDLIDNSEELDSDVLIDTLDSIDEAFEDKVISTAYLIRNNTTDIESIDNEIKRLMKLKRQKQNANDSIKEYIKSNMIQINKTKIKGDLFTISVRNNAESVNITNESKIPDNFIKYEPKISKADIKEALKNGEVVAGAELIRTQSLNIR